MSDTRPSEHTGVSSTLPYSSTTEEAKRGKKKYLGGRIIRDHLSLDHDHPTNCSILHKAIAKNINVRS